MFNIQWNIPNTGATISSQVIEWREKGGSWTGSKTHIGSTGMNYDTVDSLLYNAVYEFRVKVTSNVGVCYGDSFEVMYPTCYSPVIVNETGVGSEENLKVSISNIHSSITSIGVSLVDPHIQHYQHSNSPVQTIIPSNGSGFVIFDKLNIGVLRKVYITSVSASINGQSFTHSFGTNCYYEGGSNCVSYSLSSYSGVGALYGIEVTSPNLPTYISDIHVKVYSNPQRTSLVTDQIIPVTGGYANGIINVTSTGASTYYIDVFPMIQHNSNGDKSTGTISCSNYITLSQVTCDAPTNGMGSFTKVSNN